MCVLLDKNPRVGIHFVLSNYFVKNIIQKNHDMEFQGRHPLTDTLSYEKIQNCHTSVP